MLVAARFLLLHKICLGLEERERAEQTKRKRDIIELSSSNYDNEPQMKKKFIAKLDEVLEEMKYLRRNVIDVMKLYSPFDRTLHSARGNI